MRLELADVELERRGLAAHHLRQVGRPPLRVGADQVERGHGPGALARGPVEALEPGVERRDVGVGEVGVLTQRDPRVLAVPGEADPVRRQRLVRVEPLAQPGGVRPAGQPGLLVGDRVRVHDGHLVDPDHAGRGREPAAGLDVLLRPAPERQRHRAVAHALRDLERQQHVGPSGSASTASLASLRPRPVFSR